MISITWVVVRACQPLRRRKLVALPARLYYGFSLLSQPKRIPCFLDVRDEVEGPVVFGAKQAWGSHKDDVAGRSVDLSGTSAGPVGADVKSPSAADNEYAHEVDVAQTVLMW